MPRVTLDIDASVLAELKQRRKREGRSLGQLVSELLAHELDCTPAADDAQPLNWRTKPMGARFDIDPRQ